MTKLLRVTGKELVSILEKLGFFVKRIKGSHHFMKHPDGRITVIPVHSNETLGPGIISKILKDVDITKEKLQDLI